MAPTDLGNGKVDKETAPRLSVGGGGGGGGAYDNEDIGEYGNLVRYISNYRDGRRASTVGGDDDEPKKWFWQKKGGMAGGDFETPDDWLNTDMKAGLKSHDVEARRKRTGWNELTTEKENMFLKFLSFFTGPILYGKSPKWTPLPSPLPTCARSRLPISN